MVKLHLPHIYMFLFSFLIWTKYDDDDVFITTIVCFDYEFENEEGTRVFLLEAPNSFCWALQALLAVKQKWWWSWIQYKIREKERKTRDAPRSKPQKKEESVFEEVGADTKNSERRAWEDRIYDPKSVEKFGGIVE